MVNRKLTELSKVNIKILAADHLTLGEWWHGTDISSPFTRIYMVTEGIGYLHYRNTDIRMTPGNIYIIPSGLRFSYRCEVGFSKTFFHISVPLATGIDIFESFSECIVFSDTSAVQRITDCLQNSSIQKLLCIKTYLYSLVYQCTSKLNDIEIGSFSDFVSGIIRYIDDNLTASLTLAHIADALFVSPDKIRKSFRKETGVSLGKYLGDRLMYRAELEVRCSDLSMKEISDKLGFSDQFYFSRCFSQKFGIPPLKYRKKVLHK